MQINASLRSVRSACLVGTLFLSLAAWGDDSVPSTRPVTLKGEAALGDWTTDAPGVRRLVTQAEMPAPSKVPYIENFPNMVAKPADGWPQVPPGFSVDQLATGLVNPRNVKVAPNGDIFVSESGANRIHLFRLSADGSKVDQSVVFAEGLTQPFGIAFYPPGANPKYIYIANTNSVIRYPYSNGDLKATGTPEKIADISGGGKLQGGGHWTRDVVFSLDGKKMYVSVGSKSNSTDDPVAELHRANVLEYNPDGTGMRIYASGIRNAVGLAVNPTTGQLWGSVNERDEMGDNLPPDYITHIEDGGFYGWPWFYIGNHQDPKYPGAHPELANKVLAPDVLLQAHSASLCMAFYTGTTFPAQYRGDGFAAEHGSWNRAKRTGYKIVRIPMHDGKATGEYEDFVTGLITKDGNVWARPVGIAVDPAGDLIFSDDGSNSLWRVRYMPANAQTAPAHAP